MVRLEHGPQAHKLPAGAWSWVRTYHLVPVVRISGSGITLTVLDGSVPPQDFMDSRIYPRTSFFYAGITPRPWLGSLILTSLERSFSKEKLKNMVYKGLKLPKYSFNSNDAGLLNVAWVQGGWFSLPLEIAINQPN